MNHLPRAAVSLALACGIINMLGTPLKALEVEDVIWGFDGRVMLHSFNPLNVLVSNPTDYPVDVTLQLTHTLNNSNNRVGAPFEERVALSPFGSRWVQFYPYVASEYDSWTVSWGRGPREQFDLPDPKLGQRARISLVDPSFLTRSTGKIRALPENLFPTFVSATETLGAVFLDHAPRWKSPNRKQAFMDWLHHGGAVYLVPDPAEGTFPTFGAGMEVLNTPLDAQRVGNGYVVRVNGTLDDAYQVAQQHLAPTGTGDASGWDTANRIFTELRHMTTPSHNWGLIHLMSWTYLGLVFPGWYLLSRRNNNYRTTILAFLGIALLFTFAFHIVGKRGYGESTTVNSVAIATPIGGDEFEVVQWSNVFVTDGQVYDLSHEGDGHLYSTGQSYERVNGLIDNGVQGRFLVDIPLFSARSYLHRTKVSSHPIEPSIIKFAAGNELTELLIQINDESAEFSQAHVLYRDASYTLHRVGNELQLGVRTMLDKQVNLDLYQTQRYRRYDEPPETSIRYDQLLWYLVCFDLGVTSESDIQSLELPNDRIRIYFYADMPDAWKTTAIGLGEKMGKVLYAYTLRIPNAPIVTIIESADEEESDEDPEEEAEDDENLGDQPVDDAAAISAVEAEATTTDETEGDTE